MKAMSWSVRVTWWGNWIGGAGALESTMTEWRGPPSPAAGFALPPPSFCWSRPLTFPISTQCRPRRPWSGSSSVRMPGNSVGERFSGARFWGRARRGRRRKGAGWEGRRRLMGDGVRTWRHVRNSTWRIKWALHFDLGWPVSFFFFLFLI